MKSVSMMTEEEKKMELEKTLRQIAVAGRRLAERAENNNSEDAKQMYWKGILASAIAEELLEKEND